MTQIVKIVEKCRGCKRELKGGGQATVTHPKTGENCKWNFYGGYVCSYECDKASSEELERTMPGNQPFHSLSTHAQESLRKNWPNR